MLCSYSGTLLIHKMAQSTSHATSWENLENILLSERNPMQGLCDVWFHSYKKSRLCKSVETMVSKPTGVGAHGINY